MKLSQRDETRWRAPTAFFGSHPLGGGWGVGGNTRRGHMPLMFIKLLQWHVMSFSITAVPKVTLHGWQDAKIQQLTFFITGVNHHDRHSQPSVMLLGNALFHTRTHPSLQQTHTAGYTQCMYIYDAGELVKVAATNGLKTTVITRVNKTQKQNFKKKARMLLQ